MQVIESASFIFVTKPFAVAYDWVTNSVVVPAMKNDSVTGSKPVESVVNVGNAAPGSMMTYNKVVSIVIVVSSFVIATLKESSEVSVYKITPFVCVTSNPAPRHIVGLVF